MAIKPEQMEPLNLKVEGCSVRVSWVMPNNGGSNISAINLQIRESATKE